MGIQAHDDVYAFSIDSIINNSVYYRTVSICAGKICENGRDMRKAYPVDIDNFERAMKFLGQSFLWVRNENEKAQWIEQKGWMLSFKNYVYENLECLLKKQPECVKSPLGLFWDKSLRSRVASRRTTHCRKAVLKRDGNECLLCHSSENLTMEHVIPFSKGGETTTDNLVTLCSNCNNAKGNEYHSYLFGLANLHCHWDTKEVCTDNINEEVISIAMSLSKNILISSCSLSELMD